MSRTPNSRARYGACGLACASRPNSLPATRGVAHEETPERLGAEFARRSRIGAGGYQGLAWLAPLLHPRFGWLALAFFSHKLLRWFGPFFHLGLPLFGVYEWDVILSGYQDASLEKDAREHGGF